MSPAAMAVGSGAAAGQGLAGGASYDEIPEMVPGPDGNGQPRVGQLHAADYAEINPAAIGDEGYAVLGQDCYAAIAPGILPDNGSGGGGYLQLEAGSTAYGDATAQDLQC